MPQNVPEDKSSSQRSEFSKQKYIVEEFRSCNTPTTKDYDDERYVTEDIEPAFTGNSSCSEQGYITLAEMTL
jgi:hypothetical protein